MPEILLIGTAHEDINNYSRLERELTRFKPEIVLLEGPKEKYAVDMFSFDLSQRKLREMLPVDIAEAAIEFLRGGMEILWQLETIAKEKMLSFFIFVIALK